MSHEPEDAASLKDKVSHSSELATSIADASISTINILSVYVAAVRVRDVPVEPAAKTSQDADPIAALASA